MRPLRHARNLHREALRHLTRHLHREDPEDLHQFRVCLKQLKALFSATRRPGVAWQPYRDLYRLSSPVRDLDVAGISSCDRMEGRLLRQAGRLFLRRHRHLPRPAAVELSPLRKPDVEKRAFRDLRKLRESLNRIPPAREWHELRKLCKRAIHNGRYAGWTKSSGGNHPGAALLPFVEAGAERIGQWHDPADPEDRRAAKDAGARTRAALRQLRAALKAERRLPD